MKIQYCYYGLIDSSGHQTLIEHLKSINNIVFKSDLTGIFYYANQSFFYCLEGHPDLVQDVAEELNASGNSEKICVESHHSIVNSTYKHWSMRYVHQASKIMQFFHKQGFDYFKPLALDDIKRQELTQIILEEHEGETQKRATTGYKHRGAHFY